MKKNVKKQFNLISEEEYKKKLDPNSVAVGKNLSGVVDNDETKPEDEMRNVKLLNIRHALENPNKASIDHIKPNKTKYDYSDSVACNVLVVGASTGGKTSYILMNMLNDKNPRKILIYIDSLHSKLDPMVVKFCMEHKWTRLIQTYSYDMKLATFLNEYLESIDVDKKNPLSCYIIVDNLFANITPNSLSLLTTNRHRRIKMWFLVHAISSKISSGLSVLREHCTHICCFPWRDMEKLPLILGKNLIEKLETEVNSADPKLYRKLIYDKNRQLAYVE